MHLHPGELHVGNGFTIQRIAVQTHNDRGELYLYQLRCYSAGGHPDGMLLAEVKLTEDDVASMVASVSARPQTVETFRAVRAVLRPVRVPDEDDER